MEPNINTEQDLNDAQELQPHPINQVTTFSKYLALLLFILLPFVGGYIGYVYMPDKVVEIETVIHNTETKPVEVIEAALDVMTVIKQGLWSSSLEVDTDGVVSILPLSQSATESGIELNIQVPKKWTASFSENGGVESAKAIRFSDSNLPGKVDTDVPLASVNFTFLQRATNCEEMLPYINKPDLYPENTNLSSQYVTAYDSGWNSGWANLPTRSVCLDTKQHQGILIVMYPITVENQNLLDEMLNNLNVVVVPAPGIEPRATP